MHTDHSRGWFGYIVTGDGEPEKKESKCGVYTGNLNFFVLEGCYRYLEAWLDWESLPPWSMEFPHNAEPMSIASEFYEIVDTQELPRSEDLTFFFF